MNNTRALILVCLILCLGGLGYLFVSMDKKIDAIAYSNSRPPAVAVLEQNGSAQSNSILPGSLNTGNDNQDTTVMENPVTVTELARAQAENERIRAENDKLKQAQKAAQEEQELLARAKETQNDPKLAFLNQIYNAPLVGKVTEYYPNENIVMFNSLGDAVISPGQELAIRRNSGILATIVVEYEDVNQRKLFTANVKRNSFYDSNPKNGIGNGDEIIILPAGMREYVLPDQKQPDAQPAPSNSQTPGSSINNPVMVPMEDA